VVSPDFLALLFDWLLEFLDISSVKVRLDDNLFVEIASKSRIYAIAFALIAVKTQSLQIAKIVFAAMRQRDNMIDIQISFSVSFPATLAMV